MEDITERTGVGLLDDTASALFVDFRNLGRQDLVVLLPSGPLLLLNDGEGRFTPRKDAFRFARPAQGTFTGMAAADYDRDGHLDLFVAVAATLPMLFWLWIIRDHWFGKAWHRVIFIGAVFFFGKGDSQTNSNGPVNKPQRVDENILVRPDSWSEGTSSAKVTVVEFGDFQCPACKSNAPVVDEMRLLYKDKIRYVWRQFPLTQIHEFAFASSEAAEAAGLQNKFWEFHKKLFSISPDLGKDKLIAAAKDTGLDVEKFTKSLDSDTVRQKVLNDQADGDKAGVNSTPSYFINGEKLVLDHLPTLDDFKSRIDPLLK